LQEGKRLSRRFGAQPKFLFGRLMMEAGIAAIRRGIPNEMIVAKTITISSTEEKRHLRLPSVDKTARAEMRPQYSGCAARNTPMQSGHHDQHEENGIGEARFGMSPLWPRYGAPISVASSAWPVVLTPCLSDKYDGAPCFSLA